MSIMKYIRAKDDGSLKLSPKDTKKAQLEKYVEKTYHKPTQDKKTSRRKGSESWQSDYQEIPTDPA